MGTRADFWIGHGPDAEWLGSVGWDGYEWAKDDLALLHATTESQFRSLVDAESIREDFSDPSMGWPWPWETSATTDYAYVFDEGKVYVYVFGAPADLEISDDDDNEVKRTDWKNMRSVQRVTFDSKRSGIFLIRSRG